MKMKRIILALMLMAALGAILAGCIAVSEFEVYEGPMRNRVRQPLSVQVLLTAKLGDIIVVSWGDGTETAWGGKLYAGRANIKHTYSTEGIYTIRVSRDGEGLGYRRVMIGEEE